MLEWSGPALAAFKHRKEIEELVSYGVGSLFGSRTEIAITGMAGVGKTILLDFLAGDGFKSDYKPPLQSQDKERKKIKAADRRMRLTTVPGNRASLPREETLHELFEGRHPVNGVIHVVANGFAVKRSSEAVDQFAELGIDSIAKYRKQLLKEELDDLITTCSAIHKSHRLHHKPSWIIVIADKIDLYHGEAAAARDYYSPASKNKFGRQIHELILNVGRSFLRWEETVPLCTHIEKFTWGTETVENQLDPSDRNAYFNQFLALLKSYCK